MQLLFYDVFRSVVVISFLLKPIYIYHTCIHIIYLTYLSIRASVHPSIHT